MPSAGGWARVLAVGHRRAGLGGGAAGSCHDCVAGFAAGSGFAECPQAVGPGQVVCHGDIAARNTVFAGGRAVAFIDWDAIFVASPMWDLAHAVWQFAPVCGDADRWLEGPLQEQGWAQPRPVQRGQEMCLARTWASTRFCAVALSNRQVDRVGELIRDVYLGRHQSSNGAVEAAVGVFLEHRSAHSRVLRSGRSGRPRNSRRGFATLLLLGSGAQSNDCRCHERAHCL